MRTSVHAVQWCSLVDHSGGPMDFGRVPAGTVFAQYGRLLRCSIKSIFFQQCIFYEMLQPHLTNCSKVLTPLVLMLTLTLTLNLVLGDIKPVQGWEVSDFYPYSDFLSRPGEEYQPSFFFNRNPALWSTSLALFLKSLLNLQVNPGGYLKVEIPSFQHTS